MFETIFSIDIIQKILANTLFVSIPEEIYWVMFILILMGEFEYWREPECKKIFHKYDISRILIPAIIVALTSNIMRYLNVNSIIMTIVSITTLYILIILTSNIFKDASALKWMSKSFIFLILGYITIGISEMLYFPFIQLGLNISINEINNNLFINFLLSLPAKFFQFVVILFFIVKKHSLLKINVIRLIHMNPILLTLTAIIVIINLLFLWIMNSLIITNNILVELSLTLQLSIIVGSILFPLLNILVTFCLILYFRSKEINNNKNIQENLSDMLTLINKSTTENNKNSIAWKLKEFNLCVDEIIKKLAKENGTVKKISKGG